MLCLDSNDFIIRLSFTKKLNYFFSFTTKNNFRGNEPSSNLSREIFLNPSNNELTFSSKNNEQ